MVNPYKRTDRVADQMQRALADIIRLHVNDPRFKRITITGVDVSPDMNTANVFFSLQKPEELADTTKALSKAAGFFRSQLAGALDLRITPKLKFIYDASIDEGNKIAALLNVVLKDQDK